MERPPPTRPGTGLLPRQRPGGALVWKAVEPSRRDFFPLLSSRSRLKGRGLKQGWESDPLVTPPRSSLSRAGVLELMSWGEEVGLGMQGRGGQLRGTSPAHFLPPSR